MVIDAWNAFWSDWVEVSKTADYDAPRLAEHATGKALRGLRLQLLSYRKRGLVSRGTPVRTRTRVTGIRGGVARVSECLDSNHWLAHDARTGQVRGSPNGKTNQVEAALRLGGGRWKVSELTITEAECAG
jgi:hypothetical protein